ncbi:hypothetical protein JQ617_23890 [Bradyrhizobium sp. KB893862 SZCCT0404]|uniref:hypothetical protein n=1 Tax=Bradyrhizobium sp. KB893862 SZCCT0404 TaxID=2807672 RepID=UPI001BAC3EDE|nr:hypothetical protein [Bradyrhizobium sp. KB893862 SZCCT0404]MBR1177014.1 hypothetical protein [Bradyrhizobium sp. KB893862 SZCCT0404]
MVFNFRAIIRLLYDRDWEHLPQTTVPEPFDPVTLCQLTALSFGIYPLPGAMSVRSVEEDVRNGRDLLP